jgi:ribose-phosphate pyrophosphokinase
VSTKTNLLGTAISRDDARRMMVFAGRASTALGEDIAKRLDMELGEVQVKTFANGEIYGRFAESIRGADVFLVQSTCSVFNGVRQSVNDSLFELLIMINAAKLASARRIVAVMPWYGYSRQDKKSAPREPITAKMIAEILQAVGVDRVLTMDLHAGQVQGFFNIPVDHMTAVPILAQYFQDLPAIKGERLVVVSPDAGRAKLASHFAEKLGASLAVLTKQRPEHSEVEMTMLIGDVQGKVAIMIDDMIDTAGTLVEGARKVRENGAVKVYAAATHGLFSPPAFERLERCEDIAQIVVTDTVPLRENAPTVIKQLPAGQVLADCIRNVFNDESVSEVFEGENQLF